MTMRICIYIVFLRVFKKSIFFLKMICFMKMYKMSVCVIHLTNRLYVTNLYRIITTVLHILYDSIKSLKDIYLLKIVKIKFINA